MNYSPYISVLILAHDRRKYLFDAVNSVLSQDLPRDKYEVLVVKYELDNDKEIDKKLEELGLRVVNTKEVSLGAKIAVGAEEAKGEVLAFLEDDDLFLPGKLSRVYEVFNRDEKIGYYHNEMIYYDIDKNEEIKNMNEFRRKFLLRFKRHFKNGLMIKEAGFWNRYSLLLFGFFGINNSSIAVKKDVILNCRDGYKSFAYPYAIDQFNHIISLELDYKSVMDINAYTIYRVHKSNASIKSNYSSLEQYANFMISLSNKIIHDIYILKKMCDINKTYRIVEAFELIFQLNKIIYTHVLGKGGNIQALPIIIRLLRHDRSYLYSPGVMLPYLISLFPRRLKIWYLSRNL